jgi:hypothetical protein
MTGPKTPERTKIFLIKQIKRIYDRSGGSVYDGTRLISFRVLKRNGRGTRVLSPRLMIIIDHQHTRARGTCAVTHTVRAHMYYVHVIIRGT